MPLATAAAIGAATTGTGSTLFGYNRENFLYDRKMRQETEYQIMDFRIKQAELWREDVRDIIGLTSVKMDTYLIVNAVQLGFTVAAFCEGRLASGTPSWLVGCHTLSLAGAFMYLLMSVWFSMHASVTAKSYEVRLLTQLVRLPVPSWSQLEGARTYASGFEKTQSKQMFRVPFALGTQERVQGRTSGRATESAGASTSAGAGSTEEASREGSGEPTDLWGLEGRGDRIYELDGSIRADPDSLRHLQIIKRVMHYWQSYDGFARVAMSMGTNQLIMGLSYYVIAYVLISNKCVIACFLVVLLFMVIATALIRLDMSLTGLEFQAAAALVFAGPCITALAAQQWRLHTVRGYEIVHLLAPLPYAFSAGWLMLLLYIAKVGEQEGGAMLPTGFRSVMYIDVFGWINRQKSKDSIPSPANPAKAPVFVQPVLSTQDSGVESGAGPAVKAMSYEGCFLKTPKPTRPEQISGKAQTPPESMTSKEMFDPTSFVPREKEDGRELIAHDVQPYLRPGYVPWRTFCSATALLLLLWWLSGVLILLQASGWSALRVSPLLRDAEESGDPSPVTGEDNHESHKLLLEQSLPRQSFLQTGSATKLIGKHIETQWPHLAGSPPRHLACGMDAQGKTSLVAASRFGLFLSQLEPALKGSQGYSSNSNASAVFQYAPPCDDLDGEAVQDVSLLCTGKDGHCQALVLHRQGQRLATCGLAASQRPGQSGGHNSLPAVMSLSDGWLGEGDAASNRPQEEVASLVLAGRCSGTDKGHCAFAETTNGRLVELKTGLSNNESTAAAMSDWYPTRILMADTSSKARGGGTLHLIENQFIGILATDGKELRAVDPRGDGGLIGRWPLPSEKRWISVCSTAGNLYLLSDGNLLEPPQLYRFPLPASLHAASESKASFFKAAETKLKRGISHAQTSESKTASTKTSTRKHGSTTRVLAAGEAQ
eukprot:TRINITY_DN7674_c0_g2_i1.p1 TRINITY_DN7674_c0_g2~~TRINITY_DN7674_c0_g2_i1.p1  ORF type:complete len:940 (+),score=134.34 TRINITY_DN7674_c0_g2_i1:152-2971(+)